MADPFFILPSDLQRTFTLTKRKYEQDFIAYYDTLITHLYLPGTSGGKKLEEDKKVVEELVKDIKHLLDPLFQHSWEEVAEIQGRMDLVAKKLQEASQQIKANLDKAEGIHKKLEEQNISEENLFNSNEFLLERVSKLSAEATKEPEPEKEPTFTERASGIADYLLEKDEDKQSIGQKFARSILSQTPYARAMEGALTSFQTVQKGKKEKQATKDKAAAEMKMKQGAVDVERENAAGMTGEDRAKAGGAASSPTGGGAKGPDFYTYHR